MVMSRIGAIDSADATTYLTSVLNGYQMQVEDVMHVVDAMSQVDIESASSVDDLAIALQRSTATAQQAGVSFERLLGYVAAVRETTQRSASVIGEAMKSILSRMGSVKAGTFLSEDLESEYEDVATYVNDVEKVLAKVGIRLRDTNKNFRDAQDVLDDVAKGWATYDDLTRQALATSIAGTRQRENFLALMQSYDKALKLENSALNSNGKAMEKYGIYQDGIAAKQDRITALAQTWVQNMGFEDAISAVFSFGEVFMKVFSDEVTVGFTKATVAVLAFAKAVKSFFSIMQIATAAGGIAKFADIFAAIQLTGLAAAPAILGVVGAIVALVAIISTLHKSASELRRELQGLDEQVSEAEGKIDDYKSKVEANNESIKQLQDTISKGAGGLVEQSEIDRLKEENKQIERQIALEEKRLEIIKAQQQQTARELYGKRFGVTQYAVGYSRTGSSAQRQVMSRGKAWFTPEEVIAEYQSEIANLEKEWQDAVDRGNVELADAISAKKTELEEELTNTVIPQLELLRDYYPEIAAVLDEYYDSLITSGEKFESAAEKLDPTSKMNLANLAKAIKEQDDLNTKMEQYGSQIDLNNRKMLETSKIDSKIAEEMGEGYATLFSRTYTEQDFGGKGTGAILVTPILPNGEVFEDWETLESYIESLMVDGKIDISKDTEGVIMGIFDEGDLEASIAKADEFGNAAHEANAAVEELASTLGLEGFTGTLDSLYAALENTENEALRAFIDELKAGGFTIQQIIQRMVQLQNVTQQESIKLESAASQITKFKDKVSAVTTAEEELASTGYVSAEAAETLAEAFGEDVYDAMTWTEKGYKVSKSALEELIEKQKESYVLALTKAQDAASAIVGANIDETLSYKEKTKAILEEIAAKKASLSAIAQAGIWGKGPLSQEAQGAINQLEAIRKAEKELGVAMTNLETFEKTITYLRSLSTSKTDAETAYERENRILEHTLYLSQQIAAQYKDNDEAAYRKEVNKQLEIYDRLMEAAHKEAQRLRALGYSDESEEIQELQKAWWGYYNERRDLQDGLADWEKQSAEDAKQAVEDALDNIKDAINDLLDEAEDRLNDKLDALDARIKKNEAIRDLHEAFFDILNEVADGMHEIDKELEASLGSADYLDDKLRQAMFNEDDYKKMSSKLNQIADESRALFKDYLSQLEMLTEDEIYKADYITDEFNRQYEYKKLEYEIAEKELALAKAQTKLQNTMMNRNVRMYKNGQWVWTADYSAVEEAKKEVRDAEYERRDAEIKLKQKEVLDKYDGIINNLKLQKDAANAEFDALKKMWERVQNELTTEEDAMTRLLKAINDKDVPELKNIINSVGIEFKNLIAKLLGLQGEIIKTPDPNDPNIEHWTGGSGTGHSSGYGIQDSFGTPSGGSASSDDGVDYAIYDENQNYIGRYNKNTGEITYNGDPNITGRKEIIAEAIDIINKDSQTTSGGGGSSGGGGGTRPSGGGTSGGGGGSSGGVYTASSSGGGTYTIGSETGKNFIENEPVGSTMKGSDGSIWTKNSDGSTTISKNGQTYKVYDTGGVLEGLGGIKATDKDEVVFDPDLSSKMLSPQKSREFLNTANALTKILDNSSALNSMLTRFADVVGGGKPASNNDSHDVYFNGNPLGNMSKADSLAFTSILRRYIPISGGGR